MAKSKAEFIEEAQRRLSNLTGDAHAQELAKIHAEMSELVRAEAAAEVAASSGSQVASLEADYKRLRAEHEALAFLAPFTIPEGVPLLLPHALRHIAVERREGQWAVTYKDKAGNPTSPDDLRAQFRADPAFARLVQGSSESEREAHRKRVELALGMSQRMH